MRPRVVTFTVAAIIAIQILIGIAVWRILPTWQDRGDFGSMFGAVAALFSGLALAGVIYAIRLQSAELALQREELKLTREELARSASAQEESASLLRQQLAMTSTIQQTEAARRRADLAARLTLGSIAITNKVDRCDLQIDVHNLGGPMREVHVTDPGAANPLRVEKGEFVPTGGQLRFLGRYAKLPKVTQIHVSYRDRDDDPRRLRLICDVEGSTLHTDHMDEHPASS